MFSEQGFRHATLEDVARALSITRPALYHYASSKDDLLADCARIARELLAQAVREALVHTTGRDQLVGYFRAYCEIVCDDFGRCFVLTDRRELTGEVADLSRSIQREFNGAVQEMLRRGAEDGSLRRIDVADAARALYGAFNGVPRWYRDGGGRVPSQIADDFLAMFLRGLMPPTASRA